MAKLYNVARMTTPTTGYGAVLLSGAVVGYLTFGEAGVRGGDALNYAIIDGSALEMGSGVYSIDGPTLTRANVTSSTNGNDLINLSGDAEVYITELSGGGSSEGGGSADAAAIAAAVVRAALDSITQDLVPDLSDTRSLGSPSQLWRSIYASEFHTALFAQETQTLFGGHSLIVPNAGTLTWDVNTTQTEIDFGMTMTEGDFVVFRAVGAVEYMLIGTLVEADTYIYNVTRDLDGSGANAWPGGSAFAVFGSEGDGRIEMTSEPLRIKLSEQGANYNDENVIGVWGDLDGSFGITDPLLGFAVGDYPNNYLKYDLVNKFSIVTGDGSVVLNEYGILMQGDSDHNILFWPKVAGVEYELGSLYGGWPGGTYPLGVVGFQAVKRAAGPVFPASPWEKARVSILATDSIESVNAFLWLESDGVAQLFSSDAGGVVSRVVASPSGIILDGDTTEVTGDISVAGDVFTTAWADYQDSSTITGWSSFTTKKIRTRRLGNQMEVEANIVGTSDNTVASFTVPVAKAANGMTTWELILRRDNNILGQGLLGLGPSASTVNCYANVTAGGFTASGTKSVFLHFFYEV